MLAGLGKVAVDGEQTLLRCADTDQAALHGVLDRLRDLGVEILDARRIETTGARLRVLFEVLAGMEKSAGGVRRDVVIDETL
jgi:hypothetical protein